MRTWVTAMVVSALVSCAGVAAAGVVLQQEQVVTRGSASWKTHRTVLLEPRRGRIVGKYEAMVVDFDQARTLMIHSAAKSYYVTPFPPPQMLGFLLTRAIVPPMVNYQKTGKRRTIAGYQCDEYSGSRKFETVAYHDVVCFSTEAPGAKEYDAFTRGLIVKLDPDPNKPLSKLAVPDGIPLAIQATIVVTINPPPTASGKPATAGAPTPATPKQATPGAPTPATAKPATAASSEAVAQCATVKARVHQRGSDHYRIERQGEVDFRRRIQPASRLRKAGRASVWARPLAPAEPELAPGRRPPGAASDAVGDLAERERRERNGAGDRACGIVGARELASGTRSSRARGGRACNYPGRRDALDVLDQA